MRIQIITDSAGDLGQELVRELGISVIPLQVILGEQEYQDGVTLRPKQLFDDMRQGKVYKTSQPAFGDVYEMFRHYAEQGDAVCIYPAFSSALSGTYQTAVMAKEQIAEEYPNFELHVIDTKCASVGQGLVAAKAAELVRSGATKDQVLRSVHHWAEHMQHMFTVDDLNYLLRGGRVSPVAAFIGGLLNIKPVLHVEDGRLIPLEKVRGRKKVLQRMVELVGERGVSLKDQTIGISHGDDLEAAEQLRDMLRDAYGCEKFYISSIGAAVGAHAGPGTLAVFCLNELL